MTFNIEYPPNLDARVAPSTLKKQKHSRNFQPKMCAIAIFWWKCPVVCELQPHALFSLQKCDGKPIPPYDFPFLRASPGPFFANKPQQIPLHSHYHLVGAFNHLEKYQSMGGIIPYIMENKKCLKPPTSHRLVA
jgi:hypothetical protein